MRTTTTSGGRALRAGVGALLGGLLAATGVSSAQAQVGDPRGTPSAAECAAAAGALTGASAPAPGSPAWWTATRCGAAGGTALAVALRSLQSESRDEPLRAAEAVLRSIRDAGVFAAARDLAANTGASPQARALGLRTMLAQHSAALVVVQLAASPDATPPCRSITVAGGSRSEGAALPADYAREALVVARAVGEEAAAPSSLRTLARCARLTFSSVASLPVSAASIELTYLCGNRFRVRNLDGEWVDLTYDVDGTDDSGDLTVPPRGETVVTTDATGTTRLFVNPDHARERGELVQTRANGGTSCTLDTPPEVGVQLSSVSGRTVTVAARFRDDKATDGPWKVTIDWGDGSAPAATTSFVQTWTAPLSRAHAYASAGTFTIRLTVADKGGRSTSQTVQAIVP